MTIYDAAMVGVIIAGMAWGIWRGITWQLASIASLILGYSASRTLSGQVASSFPGEPVVARGLAMLVIYAVVSGGVFLVAWVVRTTLRKLQFEAYDRHLGMVLGGLEGALLGMVATLFVVSLAPQTREPIFSSHAGVVVGQVMSVLGPVLPDEARQVLAPFWDGSRGEAEPEMVADEAPAKPRFAREEPRLATEDGPEPKPVRLRIPSRSTTARQPARGRDSDQDQDRGGDDLKATLDDVIDEGKTRLGRAIVDRAEKELQKIGSGDSNGRSVERR